MERTVRTQRSLSKQEGIEEENDMPPSYEKSPTEVNGKPQLQSMGSSEEQLPTQNGAVHRSRNKVKLLVRSHAVREETSPPPEPQPEPQKQETRKHKDWQPPLSRGNSREQQFDTNNPVDLHQFIVETLNRNHKDRMLLLKIESELINLANDSKRTMHKFAQMSSYQRMLVHRVAAYFNMEHNVDTSGVAVIVNTTKTTRIPDSRFRDFVREDLLLPEEPRRSILKRDSSSFDETGSFKFDADGDGIDDLTWESEDAVFTNCDLPNSNQRNPRLLKVESYESGDTLRANSLRPSVAKSHSFNGYEPQNQQPHVQPTRVLTKQDSGSSLSSRISPSSSGYKSQRSDATLSATPSPTATPNLHTQSGQPYTNPDGSIYHYDPNNPPRVMPEGGNGNPQVTNSQQVSQSPAKHGEWRKKGKKCKNFFNINNMKVKGEGGGVHVPVDSHPTTESQYIPKETSHQDPEEYTSPSPIQNGNPIVNNNTIVNGTLIPCGIAVPINNILPGIHAPLNNTANGCSITNNNAIINGRLLTHPVPNNNIFEVPNAGFASSVRILDNRYLATPQLYYNSVYYAPTFAEPPPPQVQLSPDIKVVYTVEKDGTTYFYPAPPLTTPSIPPRQ